MPLNLPRWSGLSVLFREQAALDECLRCLPHCENLPSSLVVRSFECPPKNTLDRPIIVVGAPRSGTTLLFETLANSAGVWTVGGESHSILENKHEIPGEDGNRMTAEDANEEARFVIPALFVSLLRNRHDQLYLDQKSPNGPERVRLLEKTPKNSLRIPFLRALFPDCRFVFLYREPTENIGSLIDAWGSPDFSKSYKIDGARWKFLLPPDWKSLIGQPIPVIAAAQWRAANEFLLNDLAKIPNEDWCFVRYEQLVNDPASLIRRLCDFASLEMDQELAASLEQPLPLSRSTLTPPSHEKWRKHITEIDRVLPSVQDVVDRVSNAGFRQTI